MGAQQSTSNPKNESAGSTPAKTCYYELLAVERDASEEELKKAYRRKALELHPDRNINDVAAATQNFAEVQAAYDILSDPQERAWYDSHRESILAGDDGLDDPEYERPPTFQNVRLTTTAEINNLVRSFNPTIPFNDEPTGFFGIARQTFEHLALEEKAATGSVSNGSPDYPSFGTSGDDYDRVVKPFYSSWAGFSTRKTFSWRDEYRVTDEVDRRVRRLMEKRNKKVREDAIREFNNAVRFLVAFVRKRDPRYVPNTQTYEDLQKSARQATAAQAARARAANKGKMSSYETPSWVKPRDDSTGEQEFPSSSEEESELELLECLVCDKTFKSEKQLHVHESSKKHIKALQKLRWKMRKEGKILDIDGDKDAKGSEGEEGANHQGEQGDEFPDEVTNTDRDPAVENATEMGETIGLSAHKSHEDNDKDDESTTATGIQELSGTPSDSTPHQSADSDDDLAASAEGISIADSPAKKKIGKAKTKRRRKAAQATQNGEPSSISRCTICHAEFSSRTKLFQHIRDQGHAALVESKPEKVKEGKRRR